MKNCFKDWSQSTHATILWIYSVPLKDQGNHLIRIYNESMPINNLYDKLAANLDFLTYLSKHILGSQWNRLNETDEMVLLSTFMGESFQD